MKDDLIMRFDSNGIVVLPISTLDDQGAFLRKQSHLLAKHNEKLRPWHYWELHNPWSRSSHLYDSWGFLDVCQSPALLAYVRAFLGPDVVLFDSRFSPDLREQKHPVKDFGSDSLLFPVDPLRGLTLRIPIVAEDMSNKQMVYLKGSHRQKPSECPTDSISITPNSIICHDAKLHYLIQGPAGSDQPYEYLIRYFPASSLYLRDEDSDTHRNLTDQFPLLNYAKLPLWLVCGEDKANNDFVTGFLTKPGRWVTKG